MNCTRCELGCVAQQNWVVSDPPELESLQVMVIGDNPYEWETSPFTGKAAGYLKSILQVDDAYFTYAVKCSTAEGVKIPAKASKTCVNEYLLHEVAELKPQFILVVGAPATKAVLGKAKITEVAGQVFDWMGAKVMPIISPSAVFRDPSKEPTFKRTMAKFHDLIGGIRRLDSRVEWTLLTEDRREEFYSVLETETQPFAYDLETTGLKYYLPDERINCIGVHLPSSDTTWVIPNLTWGPVRLAALVKRLASKPSGGHNVKFDNLWMWAKYGVTMQTVFDTMLASHLTDENRSHKLKELAPDLLGVTDYDIKDEEKKGQVDDLNRLYGYNAKDAKYTSQLRDVFDQRMATEPEVRLLYDKMVMPMSQLFCKIERSGHFVDLPRFAETEIQLEKDIARSLKELNTMVGREINWNSPPQVGKMLFEDLGIECQLLTPTGAPSTSEDALAGIDHPVVKLLQDYRGFTKFLSTYIVGWKPLMVDEYLYTSTKLHGTVTGRYSSRLHQVPRDGTIRNLITAPPGYTFVQADLSQAELRAAAILSGDPELLTCYANNIDVHWRTAMSMVRGDPHSPFWALVNDTVASLGMPSLRMYEALAFLEEVGPDAAIAVNKRWKEIRKYAKAVNFGFLYGMGANKFQVYALTKYGWAVSKAEAAAIRDTFFSMYRGLPLWHERQRALVRMDGFVHNLAGRKRRLPGIWSDNQGVRAECERQAINSPVQGFIGDYKAMAMLSLEEAAQTNLPPSTLIQKGEVHDSVLMWVKDEYLNQALPLIKYSMENPPLISEFGIDLPVKMAVDIEVGRWGAGKTWKEEIAA